MELQSRAGTLRRGLPGILTKSLIFLQSTLPAFLLLSASGQNMSDSVQTFAIKFAPGTHQARERGTASYARSYVYKFSAKKGQAIELEVVAKEPQLTYSVFGPGDSDELAFKVKRWSGQAKETGTHSITLVMNNKKAKSVPYVLTIKVE